MTQETARRALDLHHASHVTLCGILYAMEVFTKDGDVFCEWTRCPMDNDALKLWLGY